SRTRPSASSSESTSISGRARSSSGLACAARSIGRPLPTGTSGDPSFRGRRPISPTRSQRPPGRRQRSPRRLPGDGLASDVHDHRPELFLFRRVIVNQVLVRPNTSWMSVLGGWIATIGAMALVAPAVAGVLAGATVGTSDITPAVPVVVGIFISYLIGGYVAGRMAGYRTSWHGMLTAFFSLFVLLVMVLVSYAAANGAFTGVSVDVTTLVPGTAGLNIDSLGNALTFGALLGFL